MFERFTDGARGAVHGAQRHAGALHHGWIGTEHLLLGIAREGEGVGAQILRSRGVDRAAVRAALERDAAA